MFWNDFDLMSWIVGLLISGALVLLGYLMGRFGKAWHKSGIPVIGKLVVDGEEVYLDLTGLDSLEDVRKYPMVSMSVLEVKPAEKTAAKME